MKHRRSIDLIASHEVVSTESQTLATLPQWYILHARCAACRHETMIDRRRIAYRCGKDISLAKLVPRLTCSGCGNRGGNHLLLGKLPRD